MSAFGRRDALASCMAPVAVIFSVDNKQWFIYLVYLAQVVEAVEWKYRDFGHDSKCGGKGTVKNQSMRPLLHCEIYCRTTAYRSSPDDYFIGGIAHIDSGVVEQLGVIITRLFCNGAARESVSSIVYRQD